MVRLVDRRPPILSEQESMDQEAVQSEDLTVLHRISEALNREAEVEGALNSALGQLVNLMGLETAWITLANRSPLDQSGIESFSLGAHSNLPQGLAPENPEAWSHTCTCQDLMRDGNLTEAYTEVSCSRLAKVEGDRRGLTVHASTPLVSGDRQLGILNIAAKDWNAFNPRSLALLTIVGNQIGVALERAQLFDLVKERHVNEQAVMLVFSNQLLSGRGQEHLTKMLVNEVASLLNADACSLLLVDDDNSWLDFVAANGWKEDPVELTRKLSLEAASGPGLVMRSQKPLLVEDLQRSGPTSWSPPWLESEGFRGHAVVPLIAEDRSIGALMVNSRSPRMLTADELRLLGLMANQAAIAIETARLQRGEVELLRRDEELAIGRKMQRSLMPTVYPHLEGYEFAVAYEAARQVGGDFYDFCWPRGEGEKLGLIIGDVAGKGVPAALFMAMSRTNIRSAALSGRSPSEALKRANELILNDSQADVFLSAIYAMLDPTTGRLIFANGGHNRPLFIEAATGEIRELSARGIILGQFEEVELEEEAVEFSPGDAMILYTDGVTEAINGDEQPFGEDRLMAILASNAGASVEAIVAAISDAVVDFAGSEPQADDFTILAVARTPST
jgi:sigma-B regulation protein RsbU (phosphoserine phosphatase)